MEMPGPDFLPQRAYRAVLPALSSDRLGHLHPDSGSTWRIPLQIPITFDSSAEMIQV